MNALPASDLSADLVTDSAYANSIHPVAHRLTILARTAGLRLIVGSPRHDDDAAGERLPLTAISEATARDLAACLTTDHQQPPGLAEAGLAGAGADGVAAELEAAARAAGIGLEVGSAHTGPGGERWLPLGEVDRATATALADRIESSMAGLLHCAHLLQNAVRAAGIDTRARASGGVVAVGDLAVTDGLALLRRLAPDAAPDDIDPDDPATGQYLADSLTTAIRAASGSPGFEALYAGFCRRCRCEPTLILGSLEPEHAHTLTTQLSRAAR
ncbi:hypothetical protein V2S66_18515 [Streptomyces sp. V4-01]|uniref:Uncharacterized protein n=1 Tax=Actinacidiphila polyblastidii TaxID=3110430 RepID=A0ABU7PE31_9ACTN|nr:hypothetical protein [Streptomyces sp. V4-01]